MAEKELFIDAIKVDGLQEAWLTRSAEFPDLPSPGTLEESTLTIAQYCVNCNKFLQLFNGVTVIDLLLRGAQRSASALSMVLLSAERKPTDF